MMLAAFDQASRGGERGPHFLFPFLLFFLIGMITLRMIRRRRGGHHHHANGTPMQTLQDRFARGEIDQAEFEHRKAVLDGAEVVPPAPRAYAPPPGPVTPTDVSDEGPDDGPVPDDGDIEGQG